jgi:hypothetical protein
MDWISDRIEEGRLKLQQLLSAPKLGFDDTLRSKLPTKHGLYIIYGPDSSFLRSGRTNKAGDGLQQRIYKNHFMGDQPGNLRQQLVGDGTCSSLEQTKPWIRANCVCQFVVEEDYRKRVWAEHFILSIIRPKYCD